jgi:hypothetical protein
MDPNDDLTRRHDKLREEAIKIKPDSTITIVKLSEKEKEDMYNKWVKDRGGR